MFQLTRFSHNTVFFRNQNARYTGTRCICYCCVFHLGQVLKFGAPSRYNKGALFKNFEWIGLLSDLILMLAEKNQSKHSKFDTKFIIRHPVVMTWTANQQICKCGISGFYFQGLKNSSRNCCCYKVWELWVFNIWPLYKVDSTKIVLYQELPN